MCGTPLVASAFGGGHLTDAFYAAFRLSNLFRRMLGEGPCPPRSSRFFRAFGQHEPREARDFFQSLFTSLGLLLLVIVGVGILASPLIVSLAAGGLSRPPGHLRFDRHSHAANVSVSFLCLFGGHFVGGVERVGPFLYSGPGAGHVVGDDHRLRGVHQTVGHGPHAGAWPSAPPWVGRFISPWCGLSSVGKAWRPVGNGTPATPTLKRRVTLLILPALWGLSIDQVNAYVDTICASFLRKGL
jgi:putative peptidoglycan lipid II flippase